MRLCAYSSEDCRYKYGEESTTRSMPYHTGDNTTPLGEEFSSRVYPNPGGQRTTRRLVVLKISGRDNFHRRICRGLRFSCFRQNQIRISSEDVSQSVIMRVMQSYSRKVHPYPIHPPDRFTLEEIYKKTSRAVGRPAGREVLGQGVGGTPTATPLGELSRKVVACQTCATSTSLRAVRAFNRIKVRDALSEHIAVYTQRDATIVAGTARETSSND